MAASLRACLCWRSNGLLVTRNSRWQKLVITRTSTNDRSESGDMSSFSIFDREDLRKLYPDIDNIDPRDRLVINKTKSPDQLPIVHLKCSYNNTMFTVTDAAGNTLIWTSAGAEGYKNARRGTNIAAQAAGTSAAYKAIKLGIKRVNLKIKGVGPNKLSALKGLTNGGISVHSIQDVTPVPHNGCRPRKAVRK